MSSKYRIVKVEGYRDTHYEVQTSAHPLPEKIVFDDAWLTLSVFCSLEVARDYVKELSFVPKRSVVE